jgi:hypothetical protein
MYTTHLSFSRVIPRISFSAATGAASFFHHPVSLRCTGSVPW